MSTIQDITKALESEAAEAVHHIQKAVEEHVPQPRPATGTGSYGFTLLPCVASSEAIGITDQGHIIGGADGVQAFWRRTSTGYADPVAIPMPPVVPAGTRVQAISDNGRYIVGGDSKAIYWPVSESGDIGTPQSLHRDFFAGPTSAARGVNNNGKVVGEAAFPGYMGRTVAVWTISPPSVDTLGLLDNGGDISAGYGISNSGDVAGQGNILGGKTQRAGYWCGKMDVELPPLPGFDKSYGKRLNDDGIVIGRSTSPTGGVRATRWRVKQGKLIACAALRQLPGTGSSSANDINIDGLVVGSCDDKAVLWAGAVPIALESLCAPLPLGWRLKSANAINDNGWIAGVAVQDGTGAKRGFVLMPV